jgi:2-iminobutanoate/2-iminopropanoate deaminase
MEWAAGYQLPVSGFRLQGAGYQLPGARRRAQTRKPETGNLILLTLAISPFTIDHSPLHLLMQKNIINTTQAPAPIGPYSQAVQAGNMLFISGQVPINPATGTVEATDVAGETDQVMKNLQAILTQAGYDFSHIVKTTIFLSDMSHFNAVNEVYGKYFTGNYPARETVAVKGLPRSVNVEISMIAAK